MVTYHFHLHFICYSSILSIAVCTEAAESVQKPSISIKLESVVRTLSFNEEEWKENRIESKPNPDKAYKTCHKH